MEINNLYAVISTVVFIGVILGVGILTFDRFADAVKTPTDYNETTVTITAGAGTLTYDEVNSITSVGNDTFSCSNFNTAGNTDCMNWTEDGVLTFNSSRTGDVWVLYNYEADSKTTTELDNVRNATATISSNWLSLIVTVIVLSIIMLLVIKSFGGMGGSRK